VSELEQSFHDLAKATEPSPARLARIHAGRPRSRRVWIVVSGAVAAALLLWLSRPPAAPVVQPHAPVDIQLDGETFSGELGRSVRVQAEGRGEVAGHEGDLHFDWVHGTLTVEVIPGQSTQVEVVTPEARVVVVGTLFTVERDALGTTVKVDRGRVDLSCGEEASLPLAASADRTCPPTTPAGWLRRATTRFSDGQFPQVLQDIDVALPSCDQPQVALELRLLRVASLSELKRTEEANDALDEALVFHPDAAHRIQRLRDATEATPD